jgi:hypothetical protein
MLFLIAHAAANVNLRSHPRPTIYSISNPTDQSPQFPYACPARFGLLDQSIEIDFSGRINP